MKRMFIAAAALPLCFARAADETVGSSATWTQAEIAAHAAADTVTVAAGATLSFDVSGDVDLVVPFALAGPGAVRVVGRGTATGGRGTITFSGANAFEGGFSTEAEAAADDAIYVYGTQPTSFVLGNVVLRDRSHVWLRMSEIANDFEIANDMAVIGFDAAGLEFRGSITASGDARFQPSKDAVIRGAVTTPADHGVRLTGEGLRATLTLAGKVTTKYLGADHGKRYKLPDRAATWNHGRGSFCVLPVPGGHDIRVLSPGLGPETGGGSIIAGGVNAFGPAVELGWGVEGAYRSKKGQIFDLAGFDQVLDRLQTYAPDKNGFYTDGADPDAAHPSNLFDCVVSGASWGTKPTRLTLRGTADAWTMSGIRSAVTLDWHPAGDFVQTFSNRVHDTTGDLIVSRGTLALGRLVQFTQVPEVRIRAGARLVVDTGQAADGTKVTALPALKRLSIGEGGVFEVRSGGVPVAEAARIEITAGGKVKLAAGRGLSVAMLVYDGQILDAGTYQAAAWLEGGSVTVTGDEVAENLWRATRDGDWSDGANWTRGLPVEGQDVGVSFAGARYTLNVGAPPPALKSLTVRNEKAGQTATVRLACAVEQPGGFPATVGEGGVLEIGNGGSLTLTDPSPDALMALETGGEVRLMGDGKLYLKATKWKRQMLRPMGGKVALADDATLCVLPKGEGESNALSFFGDGDFRFAGRATLTCATPDGTRATADGFYAVAQTGAVTSRMEFVEAATFGPGQSPASFMHLGASAGHVQVLRLASDAVHCLPSQLIVGIGAGEGVLDIEAGTVRGGWYGLAIAGLYTADASFALTPRGTMRMSGGTLRLATGLAGNPWPLGLVVGDGAFCRQKNADGTFAGGDFRGLVEMTGGAIVGEGANTACVLGVGFATGRIRQSGGTVTLKRTEKRCAAFVGLCGGTGEWALSGGAVDIAGFAYVGGVTTNEVGVYSASSPLDKFVSLIGERLGQARGTLRLTGGTFKVGKDLVLSGDGTGALELGPDAALAVGGRLDARAGSKLVVDVRGYTGHSRTLATFAGGTATAFDEANVALLQDRPSGYRLDVAPAHVRVVSCRGTALIVR